MNITIELCVSVLLAEFMIIIELSVLLAEFCDDGSVFILRISPYCIDHCGQFAHVALQLVVVIDHIVFLAIPILAVL